MATEFCQRCKQAHAGRICDYDQAGECAETRAVQNDMLDTEGPAVPAELKEGDLARSK
jgi:hypothetical protein